MIITRMRIVIGLLLKWSFCVIPVIHSGADAVARELTFRETASLVSTYLDESLEMAGYETPRLLIALPGDRIPDGCISREGVREIWGSHYCPKTMTVVLEVYELETMRREFGDGAIAYAIAHEYAHYLLTCVALGILIHITSCTQTAGPVLYCCPLVNRYWP